MNKYDAQTAAHDAYITGITTHNRLLEYTARDLHNHISDSNRLDIASYTDVSDIADPIDADAVYACIAFAAALTVQPQPLPDHAKSFREVHHALRNDAHDLHNVRTVLCGRKPVQSCGRNVDGHSHPWRTRNSDGNSRNPLRWRKLPVLAGCGRG